MSTPATEEYLELLYRLRAGERGVRPATVARELNVSTASVAEMLGRLEGEQLVYRDADRAVRLAETGLRVGRATVRKHRLVERLLHGVLGRPWDAVHDEACRFEHVMTDEITDSIARALGQPATCPHGNPIPSDSEDAEVAGQEPLAECGVGRTVVVARIEDEQADLLRYLLSLGLLPGVALHVEQVAPFGGPLAIRVGEAIYAIGRDVAAKIRVTEAPRPASVAEQAGRKRALPGPATA